MSSTMTRWDRAAKIPEPAGGRRQPEIAALPGAAEPPIETLFTFMRDAELRFETLRLRIEERTGPAGDGRVRIIELAMAHPGRVRMTTRWPGLPAPRDYEVWVSDGGEVRTYSALHGVATRRPLRTGVAGLGDPDLPGMARVYRPRTALPKETLPETFVHPGGFCQNVLATGTCRVTGIATIAGREAIVVECLHPRAVELPVDRADHRFEIAVDAASGVIVRLIETVGPSVTRQAEVTAFDPDAPLPDATFELAIPPGARSIY